MQCGTSQFQTLQENIINNKQTKTTLLLISVVYSVLAIKPTVNENQTGLANGGERNVLFNDALNTFYLRLYGVRHMVKDHSNSEKGNPLPPHRLLLSINSKGSFICTISQTG